MIKRISLLIFLIGLLPLGRAWCADVTGDFAYLSDFYTKKKQLYLHQLSGDLRTLISDEGGAVINFKFSPDGKRLLYTQKMKEGGGYRLFSYRLGKLPDKTKRRQSIAYSPSISLAQFQISADSKWVAFSLNGRSEKVNGLYLYDLNAHAKTKVESAGARDKEHFFNFLFHPTKHLLYFDWAHDRPADKKRGIYTTYQVIDLVEMNLKTLENKIISQGTGCREMILFQILSDGTLANICDYNSLAVAAPGASFSWSFVDLADVGGHPYIFPTRVHGQLMGVIEEESAPFLLLESPAHVRHFPKDQLVLYPKKLVTPFTGKFFFHVNGKNELIRSQVNDGPTPQLKNQVLSAPVEYFYPRTLNASSDGTKVLVSIPSNKPAALAGGKVSGNQCELWLWDLEKKTKQKVTEKNSSKPTAYGDSLGTFRPCSAYRTCPSPKTK